MSAGNDLSSNIIPQAPQGVNRTSSNRGKTPGTQVQHAETNARKTESFCGYSIPPIRRPQRSARSFAPVTTSMSHPHQNLVLAGIPQMLFPIADNGSTMGIRLSLIYVMRSRARNLPTRPNRPEAAVLATAFKKPLFINALQICMLPKDLEKVADCETITN